MATPAFILQDVQKIPYVISEVDSDGLPTTEAGDTCTVSSSDVTVMVVVPDPTPAVAGAQQTGFIVAQPKQGQATITSHIVKANGTTLPDVSALGEVVGGVPSAQGIQFGSPVAQ